MKPARRLRGSALPAAFAFLLCALPSPALSAAEEGSPESYLEPSPEAAREKNFILAGGLAFPMVGEQGVQPEVAAYTDISKIPYLPPALQLGIKIRTDVTMAQVPYDYIPQVAMQIRTLWISDQDTSTVRNSEYFSLAVGGYAAYDFKGERSGLKPYGALLVGKYWMPFDNQPFGVDFCIEIARYFDGHPPWKERNHFLTLGVDFFRAFPFQKK